MSHGDETIGFLMMSVGVLWLLVRLAIALKDGRSSVELGMVEFFAVVLLIVAGRIAAGHGFSHYLGLKTLVDRINLLRIGGTRQAGYLSRLPQHTTQGHNRSDAQCQLSKYQSILSCLWTCR